MILPTRPLLLASLAFLIVACVPAVKGQNLFTLSDAKTIYRLDTHTEILIDSSDNVSIERILNPDFQNRFKRSRRNLTFGYLKSTIWIKITTQTTTSTDKWYLEIPAPFLEYVDFYQERDAQIFHHAQSGYYRPEHEKEISHTAHVVPLIFDNTLTSTTYIRIAGNSPKTFPLFAIEEKMLIAKTRWEDVGYGVFFGILIVMFFYNFFVYLVLKQTNYLLYICTIVCTFLIFSAASGYGGKFLWPEYPAMNYYAGRLSLGVLTIFLSIFTIRFLEVKQYSKVMYYILAALMPLGILSIILVSTGTVSSAGNNLVSFSTVVYMTTGIICRVKGNKTANYFIAAWAFYLIGGLLLTLRNSGVFDYNFWTTHFVEIGAALETIIIAFALGDRYRKLRIEKEEAQHLALKLQKEINEQLESKVQERTEQLSRANEELQGSLEVNKEQTEIIENKNAELDAFFYRISHDLKGPISSLQGLSWLAQMEVKDPLAKSYLEKQHQQIERLNTIVTGLINLIMLSHSERQNEKIDFDKLVDGCISSLNGYPNFVKITFRKDIQLTTPFHSDWTLLNAILQNLIENSIKYAGKDSPYVLIKIRDTANGVVIQVEDNGQGIHKEHQSKIFEMFYRATQNINGTGLGLYILKRSLDKLNGKIDIKSEVGVGSTFTVEIPE